MPGLGDALSKAFEDSTHDLDDLVRKAAEGEEDVVEPEEASGAEPNGKEPPSEAEIQTEELPTTLPTPAPESDRGEVSTDEKDLLLESPEAPAAPEAVSSPDAGEPVQEEAPQPKRDEPEPVEEIPAEPFSASYDEPTQVTLPAGEAASVTEPQDTPQPEPAAAEETLPPEPQAEPPVALPAAPAEAEAPPEPASEKEAEESSGLTTSEAEGTPVPFAADGVIRRRLRRPSEKSVIQPSIASAAPAERTGPDPLAECRRIPAMSRTSDFRVPLLVKGAEGCARLMQNGGAGQPAVLAVCGADRRAGTSTMATAVALLLAEGEGSRVLLVDADFRAPSLHRLLGDEISESGFAAVLAGEAKLEDAIVYCESENLAILPIRKGAIRSSEKLEEVLSLLEGPELEELISLCRDKFDAVIFDAGSAATWDGPALLSGAARAALLVVRAGKSKAGATLVIKRRIEHAGGRLVGSVLTFAASKGRKHVS